MRYIMLCQIFGQDNSAEYLLDSEKKDRSNLRWRPSPEAWIKINIDTSRRHRSRLASINIL